MQLFEVDALPYARKLASAELEEDATQWPRQVLTELFRVLPEIAEYTPDVKFMKTNEEQGYALGVVVVTNSTNSALAAQGTAGTAPPPRALIPIVVKNGRLSPLDTLMASSGKMYPLTVDRLREVLYRPESFELVSEDWGDNALWSMFAPPGAQGFGTQGGLGGMGGMGAGGIQYLSGPGVAGGKLAMLEAISDSILEPDLAAFTAQFSADPALLRAATMNGSMMPALQKLAQVEPITAKTAAAYEDALADLHGVDVAQLRFDDELGMYEVKTASRRFGLVKTAHYDRGDFLRFVGEKVAAAVDTEGGALGSAPVEGAVIVAGPGGEKVSIIERSGYHAVFNAITGVSATGHVIVGLIDGRGARLPLSLFVNSAGAGVYDQIAGTYASNSDRDEIYGDPPRGRGCFVVSESDRGHEATVELTVQGSTSDGQAIHYRCTDLTGEEITVTLQRGMRAIAAFPARKQILLPYTARFVSTEGGAPPLVATAPEADKVASALLEPRIVVTADPGSYDSYRLALRHLPKLAARMPELRDAVSHDSALFALCTAGLGQAEAHRALSKVAHEGRCEIRAADLGSTPVPDVAKIADHVVALRSLHPRLVKEAAALPDAMTVDAVLSLEFINSENVRTFIAMIPYLEKALNKICELTFAARLGVTEIPETAAARAARGLDDVIRGLKGLALRQIEELP